ncbi:peptidoglycan hydrolase-like protein with peptidoglycan-binding domain [Catenuloplanes nepalensis]|uniref:Peptidoglycan hydrolase-like protein with peptidoglycan-binding domain n=1 Tax=Catenuloplanes nepalensis TaxID=587533 RepID=A0ABT9MQ54_9ACTN|nr:peptidoglycan-binding domain-containing protein [Catenuloplanes nepalensis]MDP9793542.1 peptidoglycan hydrolase-like protein with peptidoglycan-binding domain [Catenuloplanes nepalensis]
MILRRILAVCAVLAVAIAPSAAIAAPVRQGVLEANCERGPDVYDIGWNDRGKPVREVQCLLNWTLSDRVLSPRLVVDGHYGSLTTAAVKKFQECSHIWGYTLAVDGRVGRQTLPVLREWAQYGYNGGYAIC